MTRRLALPTLAAGVALLTGLAGGGPADAASPGANGKITWISPPSRPGSAPGTSGR